MCDRNELKLAEMFLSSVFSLNKNVISILPETQQYKYICLVILLLHNTAL